MVLRAYIKWKNIYSRKSIKNFIRNMSLWYLNLDLSLPLTPRSRRHKLHSCQSRTQDILFLQLAAMGISSWEEKDISISYPAPTTEIVRLSSR